MTKFFVLCALAVSCANGAPTGGGTVATAVTPSKDDTNSTGVDARGIFPQGFGGNFPSYNSNFGSQQFSQGSREAGQQQGQGSSFYNHGGQAQKVAADKESFGTKENYNFANSNATIKDLDSTKDRVPSAMPTRPLAVSTVKTNIKFPGLPLDILLQEVWDQALSVEDLGVPLQHQGSIKEVQLPANHKDPMPTTTTKGNHQTQDPVTRKPGPIGSPSGQKDKQVTPSEEHNKVMLQDLKKDNTLKAARL